MKDRLSVSVIVPVHNRCQFLHEALESVRRQQYEPLEILIVDDGSTDDVKTCVLSYPWPIHYMRQDHRGPAAARNAGIRSTQGDLIAFLDNDDLWTAFHLDRLTGCLEANPAIQIAQGQIRNFRDSERGRFWCSPCYYLASLPSAIYRRDVFHTVGMLDESLQFGEDSDFFVRCWEHNINKVKVEYLSLLYRRHRQNMTANKNLRELGLVRIYRNRRDRIEQGLCKPRPAPLGLMRDYLGESPPAYDDGTCEPVDEALLGRHLPGREHGTGDFGNHSCL